MLEAGGFGDVIRGGCTLGTCREEEDFPTTSKDPGPGSNLRVGYSQWSRFEVAFSYGTVTPAKTNGYSQVNVPDFGRYSVLEPGLTMYAATAGLRMGQASVGIGPASYRLNTLATDENDPFDETAVTKVGALLDVGGQFPMFKKLVLVVRAQYRFVGATDIGPLQLGSRELPGTPIDFSHGFLGFGFGLAY